MPKIVCTLENASLNINGHAFEPMKDENGDDAIGVISVKSLSAEDAEHFASIPGYHIDGQEPAAPGAAVATAKAVTEPAERPLTAAQKKAKEKADAKALAAKEALEAEQAEKDKANQTQDQAAPEGGSGEGGGGAAGGADAGAGGSAADDDTIF